MDFTVAEFSGPLDLLLFLIKKEEINIFDIPIVKITSDYLSYLSTLKTTDLNELSEFYKCAALLISIKTRMLLPKTAADDDEREYEIEDPRELLVEHLIEYEKFKCLASLLEERAEGGGWIFEAALVKRELPFSKDEEKEAPKEGEARFLLSKLQSLFEKAMKNISSEKTLNMYEEVSVNEKITLINEMFLTKERFTFTALTGSGASVMCIVCCFLAVLEGIKMKRLRLIQDSLFDEILIVKRTEAVK